jgi:hypothetical protein
MKSKLIMATVLIVLLGSTFAVQAAQDSTGFVSDYTRLGYHADEMVNKVLDHNGPASTRIQTRMITAGLTANWIDSLGVTKHSLAGDTSYNPLMVILPGISVILDSIYYGCIIEPNIGGTKKLGLTILAYDSSAATLDTIVTWHTIDADSVASDNAKMLQTFNTTSGHSTHKYDPGDIIYATVSFDSTLTTRGKGMFVAMKFRQIY